ncbi:MAG: hypothetical protein ACREFP_08685, partial [Acetobacteraceae bacterium]
MSGEKCGRWHVVYDGTGLPYSQIHAHNMLMASKIALLGGRGWSAPAAFHGTDAEIHDIVNTLNANTELYNALYHARGGQGGIAPRPPLAPGRAE